MPHAWIHRLSDPWPEGAGDVTAKLGGKGAGLVRLTQAGFPVPDGFVVDVEACRDYLERKQYRWHGLDPQFTENLEFEVNRRSVASFAVRSAAAVSMPGILDSLLDVLPADVPRAIKAVFHSWQSGRAITYRASHYLHLPGTAVVVQEMVPCERAGVLFTKDPTEATEDAVVEFTWGSGQAVVSGCVTPDRLTVSRTSPNPQGSVLSRDQTLVLLDLALRVEDLFQTPVDVEWGLSAGRFVLFQARPIRSLQLRAAAERLRAEEVARLKTVSRGKRVLWIAHNLGDTVVHPTPLEWDIWSRFMSASGGLGRLYRGLGYRPPPCGFLELVAGRVYADPQREVEFSNFGWPVALDLDAVAKDPSRIEPTFDRKKASVWTLLKLPVAMWRLTRANRRATEPTERTVARFRTALKSFTAWEVNEGGRIRDVTLPPELLNLLSSRRHRVFDEFGPEAIRIGYFCGLALKRSNDPNATDVKMLTTMREEARAAMKRGLGWIGKVVDRLDFWWEAGGGLWFLTLDELPNYPTDRTRFDAVIATRRLKRDAGRLIRLPAVIDSRHLERLGREDPLPSSTESVVGTPLAPGVAEGPVWHRSDDPCPSGAVVVSETADPDLSRLFPVLSGVVVDRGGVLSHLAVLAREAGIPVVAVPDAMNRFRAGAVVHLDGTTGRVTPRTPA